MIPVLGIIKESAKLGLGVPQFGFKSKLGRLLSPAISFTSFKFTPLPPLSDMEGEELKHMTEIYEGLMKQAPTVPVIDALSFPNACYVHKLDEIVDKVGDDELKKFCKELGADYNLVKSKLGPHMIFMGIKFKNPCILAHEFGHYWNTIGQGGKVGGKLAHDLYGPAARTANALNLASFMSGLINILGGFERGGDIDFTLRSINTYGQLGVTLVTIPIIRAEHAATSTGLDNLKKCGATSEDLIAFKKCLKGAFGTYLVGYTVMPLLFGLIKLVSWNRVRKYRKLKKGSRIHSNSVLEFRYENKCFTVIPMEI